MLGALERLVPRRRPRAPAPPPAPYALPRGVPALEQDPQAARRRLLLGIAFTAMLAGGAGYLAGRRRDEG